ncbi:MAG: xylose isomerase [Candidatus Hydrogenedentes bacterium]|nr:xylose isomerase [Candidatus Hydrogenedentota bacterium]
MKEFFPSVNNIKFEGPESTNPLAFKHYNADEIVLGKSMADHLRFAVCYWHTFCGTGADPFGPGTQIREWQMPDDPMQSAEMKMRAAFELFSKLGVRFWCFHDRDIAPESDNLAETNRRLDKMADLAETLQNDTGLNLLWGTSNAFSHRRFMAGASTNPSPAVFAYAASQVKKAMEITQRLGGQGYVFWGGREGYETLLNTDMGRELDHLAKFLQMAVDYKKKIGFDGQLLIEPKPKEPTKHQYDFDAAAVYGFLLKHGLADEFKLNIESNHATLAGHTFYHELEFCVANGILGSIDANRGDLLLGWDTDQFPTNIYDTTLAMLTVLKGGGFDKGGLNFDAKVRRQSIDTEDLFYAHVGAMDAFARGLKNAAKIIEDGRLAEIVRERYAEWNEGIGARIENGQVGFEELEAYTIENGEPEIKSGRQEMIENILNEYI